MSAIVTATYKGETLDVEVFHNGHIEFPERDFQYEQAMAEFAPPGPASVQLYELWKKSPVNVICENLELPENSHVLLAADYAEHVLYIYEDKYPGDLHPRKAIKATRKFTRGEIDLSTLEKAREAAREAAWAAEVAARAAAREAAWAAEVAARAAAWAVARAARAAARAAEAAEAAWAAARTAAWAAAYNISSDTDYVEWQQARDAEVAWQVRRFVDVMEAVGQGLPWPPIEATP